MAKEYMLAQLYEQYEPGTEFNSWPTHETFVPWGQTEHLSQLEDSLQRASDGVHPIVTYTGPLEYLGRREDEEVRKIMRTAELQTFHLVLLGVVQRWADLNEKSKYFGEAYNPHITKHQGISEGEIVVVDSFSLIEAEADAPRGNRLKRVIDTYHLKG